jgi:hypothetical protein
LTDGKKFIFYGIAAVLYKDDSLEDHRILSFARLDLVNLAILPKLFHLLGKQSNQNGTISDAIAGYQKGRERVGTIESELQDLKAKREQIDSRIHELETERAAILEFSDRSRNKLKSAPTPSNDYSRAASQHILRLLREKEAFSQPRGVERKWLDEQLINKVEGVRHDQDVSFGIMELRDDKGKVDHEGGKNSRRPIGKVWLLGPHDKPAV